MIEILQSIYGIREGFVALLGIVIGVITLIISLSRARALSRTQHTFNALLEISFNDQYQTALGVLRPYFREDGGLPEDLYASAEQHQELRNALLLLLNYYEFLAGGVRRGALSERFLRDDQEFLVLNLYRISADLIVKRRQELGRPRLFGSLEWLHKRWAHN